MWRILLILGVIVATALFIVGRFILSNQESGSPLSLPGNFSIKNKVSEQIATSSASSEDEQSSLAGRVKELEFAVSDLLKQKTNTTTTNTTSLDTKVKTLETSINDLTIRIAKLEGSPAPAASSTSKSPAYISLAASGSSPVGDWTTISGTIVTIDTADYPGYTSMQFESNIQVFQTGTAYARISNKTDGTSVLSSEISTTSTSYTNLTSSTFSLPGGKKDYQLQLKSQITGYAASVQNARIKVNF